MALHDSPAPLKLLKTTSESKCHSIGVELGLSNPDATFTHLQDLLQKRAELSDEQSIILYGFQVSTTPTTVSYRTLYTKAQENAVKIESLKAFRENQPVLLYLQDHWDTILWFWSVLLANGMPVISPPFSNVEESRRKYTHELSSLLESPLCITRASLLASFAGEHTLQITTVESLSDMGCVQDTKKTSLYTQGHSTAILMLTSGSTGAPKAVCLSHEQVLAAVEGKASVRTLPPGPFLNWIGLDHVASLIEIHLQALWLGVDQVHISTEAVVSSPRIFLDLLSRHKISRSFAPNFFLAKLVSAVGPEMGAPSWDLSNLAMVASGGEQNDVNTCVAASDLFQRYSARSFVITPGFGMTETCAGAIFNLVCPDTDVERGNTVASLGKRMKGIEMRVTVGAKLARANEAGDLEVRGPVVFKRYYRNPKANAAAFTPDGWFRTGDQATIDSEGNLHLIGRAKDVININGVKFASAEVQTSLERALNAYVSRIICFATRALHTEQVTIAYIPKKSPIDVEDMVLIEDLAIEACIVSTGSRPLVFSVRDKSLSLLPVSTLGKVSGAKMRSLFDAGLFDEDIEWHRRVVDAHRKLKTKEVPGSMAVATAFEVELTKLVAETLGLGPAAVARDTTLFNLGSTSMDMIRLKNRIENHLNITVPIITVLKNPTPRSLAAALTPGSSQASAKSVEYDPVITLKSSGTKTPLWLVHPGVGEVLVFFGLAQRLSDDDRPIYALRARGFESGQGRFADISEAIDTYVTAIRKLQPSGPYALAGYSYGSMLAFEMAKALNSAHGEATVQFLGSFNLPPHIKSRMQQLNWNMCLLHLSWFLNIIAEDDTLRIEEPSYRDMSRTGALAHILESANTARLEELGLGEPDLVRWTDVAYGLQSMAREYEPNGMVDSIDVFHAIPLKVAAASREEWLEQHLSKWRGFCRTEPRFHEVEGAHYTMIGPEHVAGFASKLKAALKGRGL